PIAAIGALRNGDDEIMAIVGDVTAETPFFLIGALVDQSILGLGRAEAVEIKFLIIVNAFELLARFGFGIAAVKKAFAIFGPGCAREFDPFDMVTQILAGADVAHFPLLPIGTGRGDTIG